MSEPKTTTLPDRQSVREALDYFDRYLGFRQHFQRVPGVQAAVYAFGDVQLSVAHGLADVAASTALTPDHLFRIASHSKTFTSTVVLQLVESGRLRLDDRADRWVPDLENYPAGAYSVRDLLNHATGVFRDGPDADHWQLFRPFPDREQLIKTLQGPTAAVLGVNERFKYSNMGYSLLGLIIQAASGQTFNERVAAEVAGRLGLSNLGAEYDAARSAEYSLGYTALSYADSRVPINHVDTRAMAPATGCWANATDLVQYFAAHFPGDSRLLSDASKRLMQHGWWETGETDRQYGLGFSRAKVGERRMFGHGGGYPGHITSTVADPEGGLVVSVLTNCIDGPAESLAHSAVRLIDLAGSADRPATEVDVNSFVGRFANLWAVLDIAVLGGRLYRLHPTAADIVEDAAELEVVDADTLRIAGGSNFGSYGETFQVVRDGDRVTGLRGESGMSFWAFDSFELPAVVSEGWQS